MEEEGANERFDKTSIEKKDSIYREDLLKYISSSFERLSLRKTESLKKSNFCNTKSNIRNDRK